MNRNIDNSKINSKPGKLLTHRPNRKWKLSSIALLLVLFITLSVFFWKPQEADTTTWTLRTLPDTPNVSGWTHWGQNGFAIVNRGDDKSYLYIYGEHYRSDSNAKPSTYQLRMQKWDGSGFKQHSVLSNTYYNNNYKRFYNGGDMPLWEMDDGVYKFDHRATIAGASHIGHINRNITYSNWVSVGANENNKIALVYYDSEHKETKLIIRSAQIKSNVNSVDLNATNGLTLDIRGAMVVKANSQDSKTFDTNNVQVAFNKSQDLYHVKGDDSTSATGSALYLKNSSGSRLYSTSAGTEYTVSGTGFRYGKRGFNIPASTLKGLSNGRYYLDYKLSVKSGSQFSASHDTVALVAPSSSNRKSLVMAANDGYKRKYQIYETTGGNFGIHVTDAEPPVANTSQSPTGWTNGNVTLTVSGIKDYGGSGYSKTTLPNGTTSTSTTVSQTVTANGTYRFVIEDKEGNTTTKTFTVSNIDKTNPTVTFGTNGNSTYAQSHSTTVSASDSGSGVKTREYAWSTSSSTQPTSWTSFSNGATLTTPTSEGNHYLWVRVVDNAGNTTVTNSNVFRVDRTAPTHISSSITGESYKDGSTLWVRSGDVITVTYRQRDTLSGNRYGYVRIVGDGQDVRYYHDFNNSSNTHMIPVNDSFVNTSAIQVQSVRRTEHNTSTGYGTTEWKVRLNQSGHTYNIQYYHRDNASNNVGYTTAAVAKVDGVAPTMNVTQSITGFTKEDVVLTANATDSLSGVKRIRKPDGTWVQGSSASFTATSNGTYSFIAEDNVGNQRTQSVTVTNIDKDGPTVDVIKTPSSWTTGDVTIDLKNIIDDGVGYLKTELPDGSFSSDRNISFIATENSTYRFVLYDRLGNTTVKKVEVENIDRIDPSASFAYTTTADGSGVVITVTATDERSGVDYIIQPNGQVKNSATVTYTVYQNGSYPFVIADKAGNIMTMYAKVFHLDNTPPTLNISASTDDWTNEPVIVTIVANDDYGVEKIVLPNGAIVNDTEVVYVIEENGTYTFEAYDPAGNKVEKTLVITNIDRLKPMIDIEKINKTNEKIDLRLKYGDE